MIVTYPSVLRNVNTGLTRKLGKKKKKKKKKKEREKERERRES